MENIISGKRLGVVDVCILVWAIYAIIYVFCKSKTSLNAIAGYMSLCGEAGLDVLLSITSIYLWRKAEPRLKQFYLLLSAAFISAFFADTIYNISMNIFLLNVAPGIDTFFDIPFLMFITFFSAAWYKLFHLVHQDKPFTSKELVNPILAPMIMLVFFNFGITWKQDYLSVIGSFHFVDTLVEIVGMYFASLVLLKVKQKSLRLLGYGYFVFLIADFSIRYSFVIQRYLPFNPFEALWVLGLVLMSLALLNQAIKNQVSLDSYFGNLKSMMVSLLRIKPLRHVDVVSQTFHPTLEKSIFCLRDEDENVHYLSAETIAKNHHIIEGLSGRMAFNLGRNVGVKEYGQQD